MTIKDKEAIISFFSIQYAHHVSALKKLQEDSGQVSHAEEAAAIGSEAGIMGALRAWREAALIVRRMADEEEVKP